MPKTWQDELDEAWGFFIADCSWRSVALRVAAAFTRHATQDIDQENPFSRESIEQLGRLGQMARIFNALDALAQEASSEDHSD